MFDPLAIVTLIVIAVTAGVSYLNFRRPDLLLQRKLIFCPRRILADKEFHRLLTSSLLHADWWHLGFNMVSFFLFGRLIEIIYGPGTLLAIYIGGVLGGSLLALFLHRHHEYAAYGASGGVCGVIFSSIFLLPGSGIYIFPIPYSIPGWLFAILFLTGSFYALKNRNDGIGHDAHLGGAITGLLIATALYPWIALVSPYLYATTIAISATLAVYFFFNPLFLPVKTFLRDPRRVQRQRRLARVPRHKRKALETDRILEKIARHGFESLSDAERAHLDESSDLHQRRREP